VIRTLLCNEEYCTRRQLDRAEIATVLAHDRNLLWLDLDRPTPEEWHLLSEEFAFHPLAVEDATKGHQRAKIDRYDTFYFLVVHDIDYDPDTNRIDEHELDIFLGRNFLVTVHYEPIAEIADVAGRLGQNLALIEHGVGVLLYSLLDTIVDHYFPVVDHIRDRIHQLERRVFTTRQPRQREGLHEDIFALRTELLQLRQVIGPQRDVLAVIAA
jgi:magnesium transporter